MFVAALLCVACSREEASSDRSSSDTGDAVVSDSVQGLAAEFDRILAVPDRFITPQESHLVRELVDRQFQGGRTKTLATLLSSPEAWREVSGLWLEDAMLQFLSRVGDSPVLLDDADILQCVTDLAEDSTSRVRRRAAVVLASRDADSARTFLLSEYGRVSVSPFEEGAEPTIAPALVRLGVTVPAELTSLAAARAVLAGSGIDMDGVNDTHLSAAAQMYNKLLSSSADGRQFDLLAALAQPEQAADTMLMLYRDELQNPTPTLSEPPSDWLD